MLRRLSFLSTLLVSSSLLSNSVIADELSYTASYSTDQFRGARVGYRFTDINLDMPEFIGSPKLKVDSALNHWQDSNDTSDNITAFTISPVLSWHIAGSERPLYLEAGIGGSYFDKTSLGNRKFSTKFQFEDRISLSWQFSKSSDVRLDFGYTHYSNADIKRPNDGLDFYWLSVVQPF